MLQEGAAAEPLLSLGAEDDLAFGARARSPRLAPRACLAPLRGWRCAPGYTSLRRSDDILTDDEDIALLGGADAQAPRPPARRRETSPEHGAAGPGRPAGADSLLAGLGSILHQAFPDVPGLGAQQARSTAAGSRRPAAAAVLGPPAQARMEVSRPSAPSQSSQSGLVTEDMGPGLGNCCVCVRQDEFVAEQNFGRFLQVLKPGFHFLGVDFQGCCIQLKKLSKRVHQSTIVTRTITKDRTAVAFTTAVQQQVSEDRAFEAFYRLSDIDQQVSAYVADVVLSSVPRLTIEELFVNFDSLARQIHKHLQEAMFQYGIKIVQVLVLEARLDEQVKGAFAEMVIQRNLRGAALATAEAEFVRMVKGAEADAEQMALQGRGMAAKREALAQGIARSVFGDVETDGSSLASVASGTLVELLLTMEYFDTLREIGSRASHAVFMHKEPSAPKRTLKDLRSSPREGRTGSKGTSTSSVSGWTTSTARSIASSFGRRRPSINSSSSQVSKRSPKRPSTNPERDISAIVEEEDSDR